MILFFAPLSSLHKVHTNHKSNLSNPYKFHQIGAIPIIHRISQKTFIQHGYLKDQLQVLLLDYASNILGI